MSDKPYSGIVAFCESCLEQYGDTPQGVGWFRGDGDVRHRVMLDVIRPSGSPASLLDFGCGASHLLDFIRKHGIPGIEYRGLDLSQSFLALSRRKYPSVPYCAIDVLDPASEPLAPVDYVVMNGVFTYKGNLTQAAMFDYLKRLVLTVFPSCRRGLALNVMSKQVEWERDDLFHLSIDELVGFLAREVSRHVVIRHDYGLYEYTAYVYADPSAPELKDAKRRLEGPRR